MNLTSLMDILFVLLIAFMILAPTLKSGVNLRLPEVRNAKALREAKETPIKVKVGWRQSSNEPDFVVDSTNATLDNLADLITSRQNSDRTRPVTLEADKAVPWETMAEVVTRLKEANVANVGIITKSRES
jgi:biopolymer transport protein TolR